MNRALTIVLLLAFVVAPKSAYAFNSAEFGCRKALGAGVVKLVATTLKEQVRCHRARMIARSSARRP